MRKRLFMAAIAAIVFSSAAEAAATKCHDPKTGKFIKCPPPAAATVAPASSKAGPKHCVKGKACGNTCIKVSDVCHKP